MVQVDERLIKRFGKFDIEEEELFADDDDLDHRTWEQVKQDITSRCEIIP